MELKFNLPIGLTVNGTYTKEIELLRSNAIAEEVFTKKIAERPYTWIANVISIATKSIGGEQIGLQVREDYLKTGSVSIPHIVKQLSLADANSLLLEIHRRSWQNLVPKQEILCKYCAKTLTADIDLDKVVMSEENQKIVGQTPVFAGLATDFKYPFTLNAFIEKTKREDLQYLIDVEFNRALFKIPTLGDAIKNETYASKSIEFWRRMALDCLAGLQKVNKEDNTVVSEFPSDKFIWLGLQLFNYLDSEDLKAVRYTLREELPTMPFYYEDECPCDARRTIPFTMEASGFFSE